MICVGPAGTGKTFAILNFIHQIALATPNLRILFFRQTRTSLSESVLVTFEQEILPAYGLEQMADGASRRNRTNYVYPNNTEIVLGGMDNPTRITSTSWDIVFGNEAIELLEDGWETVRTRLNRPGRHPGLGYLIGDTNPGDPSHWIKKRGEAGRTTLWDTSHKANPAMFDGRDWTPAGVAYRESLSHATGTRRKRFFEGLWAAGEGQWFDAFESERQVTPLADYDPALPVHLSIDTGVHTGGVWWQVRGEGDAACLSVFADHYDYNSPAYAVAQAIQAISQERCGGNVSVARHDPAGGSKSGFGATTIVAEYQRAGLRSQPWVRYAGSPDAGLGLLESFVSSPGVNFLVHPRCQHTIDALANYKRKKRAGQWVDEPEDPQHPFEESIDALRSGLLDRFPEGRKPVPKFRMVKARSVF